MESPLIEIVTYGSIVGIIVGGTVLKIINLLGDKYYENITIYVDLSPTLADKVISGIKSRFNSFEKNL